MQKLVEHDKRRKTELTPIDLFKSLPNVQFEKEDGKVGSYGVHDVKEMNLETERKKQAKEAAHQMKMFLKSRKLDPADETKKRKLNSGYAEEFRNVDKNRKTLKYMSANPLLTKSREGKMW